MLDYEYLLDRINKICPETIWMQAEHCGYFYIIFKEEFAKQVCLAASKTLYYNLLVYVNLEKDKLVYTVPLAPSALQGFTEQLEQVMWEYKNDYT